MLEEYKIINIHNFRKLGMIGRGSFANVFRIQDKNSGKLYAFKNYLVISDEKDKERLSKEVSIYSRLSHPCFARYHGVSPIDFDDEPMPGIILDYYKNGSLNDILESMGKGIPTPGWNNTKTLITLYGVAAVMAYLHTKGIILRDLKLRNVLLDENFYPKLTDFETSTKENETHEDNFGTPLIMAPEFIRFMKPKLQDAGSKILKNVLNLLKSWKCLKTTENSLQN